MVAVETEAADPDFTIHGGEINNGKRVQHRSAVPAPESGVRNNWGGRRKGF